MLLWFAAALTVSVVGIPSIAAAGWNEVAPTPTPLDYSSFLGVVGTDDGGATLLGFHSGAFGGLDAGAEYEVVVQRRDQAGNVRWTQHTGIDEDCREEPLLVDTAHRGDHVAFVVATCAGTSVISVADDQIVAVRQAAPRTDEPDADTAVVVGITMSSATTIEVIGVGELFGDGEAGRFARYRLDTSLATATPTPLPIVDETGFIAGSSRRIVSTSTGSSWVVVGASGPLPHLPNEYELVRLADTIEVVRPVPSRCRYSSPTLLAAVGDAVWLASCTTIAVPGGNLDRYTIDVLDGDSGAVAESFVVPDEIEAPNGVILSADVITQGEWTSDGEVVFFRFGDLGLRTNGSPDASNWTIDTTLRTDRCDVEPCEEERAVLDVDHLDGDVVVVGAIRSSEAGGQRSAAFIERRSGPDLVPIGPARLLDTRPGERTVDGRQAGRGRVPANGTLRLELVGRAGIPEDAAAVMLNIAAVSPAAPGLVTAHPCDVDAPLAASLNHVDPIVTGNNVVVPVGVDGAVCLFSLSETDLVVDATAWFRASSAFGAVLPARVLETRPGEQTIDTVGAGVGRLQPGREVRVVVAGRAGIPSDAAGIIGNVTAVSPAGPGAVSVRTCGTEPGTSTLNFGSEAVRGNSTFVALDDDGALCIASSIATDLTIDVTAWLGAGSPLSLDFVPRIVDTREDGVTYDGEGATCCRIGVFSDVEVFGVGFRQGFERAQVAVLNVVAVAPDGPGVVTLWRCDLMSEAPLAATVNFTSGFATANSMAVPLGAPFGELCAFSSTGVDLVIDVVALG